MENKNDLSKIVATNVSDLMKQADLTNNGLAEGADLTPHTIVKILNAETNISPKTAKKLSVFFCITVSQLFSNKRIKLKKLSDITPLKEFYSNNQSNPTYFRSRAKENVVAHFLKNVFINDPFLNEGRRVKEIAKYIKESPQYKKNFSSKTIAKELDRMYESGLVRKEDKTGKGSVYYYSLPKK